jgi:hypothetical protein
MFCSPGLVFGEIEGVESHFHVLRSRTGFRRYRVGRLPFSCFARPDSFVGYSEGVRSRFLILRVRTRFRRYRGRRVPFSHFALPESYSAVPWAVLVFTFCVPGHVFGGTGGVGSRFLVLRARTRFRRYRGRRVPFSCCALPNSFSAVPGTSVLVFTFCVPGHVFGGTGWVDSRFLVLRARTHF